MDCRSRNNGAQGLPLHCAAHRTALSARSPLLLHPPLVVAFRTCQAGGRRVAPEAEEVVAGGLQKVAGDRPTPRHNVFPIAFCLVTVNIKPSKTLKCTYDNAEEVEKEKVVAAISLVRRAPKFCRIEPA